MENKLKKLRMFVAVGISPGIEKELRRLSYFLRQRYPRVKWVKPEAIHLTLKFLGDVERQRVTEVDKIIASFKAAGVVKCGATHCTGDQQIEWFKKAYGDDYVPMGVGRVIEIAK